MNERKDEKWLDDQLQQAIGQREVHFDADAWKHEHSEAYQALLARRGPHGGATISRPWEKVFIRHIGKLAVAAAIVVVAVLVLLAPRPTTTKQPGSGRPSLPARLSTNIVTFESLTLAYRRGGEEALNRQLDAAQETLGPRPDRSLLSDLLNDLRS